MVLYSISDSIDHGFTVFFGWLPHVLGFIAVLLIGWIIARVVAKLVSGASRRAGLDRALHGGTGGNFPSGHLWARCRYPPGPTAQRWATRSSR